jgi:murein DD-endopeptidase MepM/ murein hydrolase activator NlpD
VNTRQSYRTIRVLTTFCIALSIVLGNLFAEAASTSAASRRDASSFKPQSRRARATPVRSSNNPSDQLVDLFDDERDDSKTAATIIARGATPSSTACIGGNCGRGVRSSAREQFNPIEKLVPNEVFVAPATLISPIQGGRCVLGDKYGIRPKHPLSGKRKVMHDGQDLKGPSGTPLVAVGTGVIEFVGYNKGGYGNQVGIRLSNGLVVTYSHMRNFKQGLKAGDKVNQGDLVGALGATGRCTGPHLHLEVWKNSVWRNRKPIKGQRVNPRQIFSAPGQLCR